MPNRTKLPLYRAQVLRMWIDTPARHPPRWRFSLEDVGTGVRTGFADLDALIAHVLELMDQFPDQSLDTETISQQRRPPMNTSTTTNGYACPEMLVETGWVANNLHRPNTCLVEVDVDT